MNGMQLLKALMEEMPWYQKAGIWSAVIVITPMLWLQMKLENGCEKIKEAEIQVPNA